jgi:hypothetical protein
MPTRFHGFSFAIDGEMRADSLSPFPNELLKSVLGHYASRRQSDSPIH